MNYKSTNILIALTVTNIDNTMRGQQFPLSMAKYASSMPSKENKPTQMPNVTENIFIKTTPFSSY